MAKLIMKSRNSIGLLSMYFIFSAIAVGITHASSDDGTYLMVGTTNVPDPLEDDVADNVLLWHVQETISSLENDADSQAISGLIADMGVENDFDGKEELSKLREFRNLIIAGKGARHKGVHQQKLARTISASLQANLSNLENIAPSDLPSFCKKLDDQYKSEKSVYGSAKKHFTESFAKYSSALGMSSSPAIQEKKELQKAVNSFQEKYTEQNQALLTRIAELDKESSQDLGEKEKQIRLACQTLAEMPATEGESTTKESPRMNWVSLDGSNTHMPATSLKPE